MILVLDTSAAAEIILQRKKASALSQKVAEAEAVLVPELYIPEITNVFWKYYQFSDMPLDQCERGIDEALSLPDEFVNGRELYKEAFGLSCLTKMAVYDMFFLVLARRNNGSIATMDTSIIKTSQKLSIKTV